jgi:hypothetical protein
MVGLTSNDQDYTRTTTTTTRSPALNANIPHDLDTSTSTSKRPSGYARAEGHASKSSSAHHAFDSREKQMEGERHEQRSSRAAGFADADVRAREIRRAITAAGSPVGGGDGIDENYRRGGAHRGGADVGGTRQRESGHGRLAKGEF